MAEQEMYFRPPSEVESFIIRVMHGCPHNKCTFCNLFKKVPYRPIPLKEIFAGIDQDAVDLGTESVKFVTSMYLEGGDPLALPTDDLVFIMEYAKSKFPELTRFACYATALYTGMKTVDELKRLREAGLTRIFVGLESGSDIILKKTHKGCTSDDIRRVAASLKEAGIEMDVSMMLGIGGTELSRRHAVETAKLLNDIEPDTVRIRTYMPKNETELGEEFRRGEFSRMDPYEVLNELRLMVHYIDGSMQLLSEHWSDYCLFNAFMPAAKPQLLKHIDETLAQPEDSFYTVELNSERA